MEKTIEKNILEFLNKNSDIMVFSSKDFLEITNSEVVRVTLNRMADKGIIKKIVSGFYYRPRYSEIIKEYEVVSPHHFAMAMARKYNWNIAPSGVAALNLLGLSQQVPAKWSYISDGIYKKVKIGNIYVEFKKKNNREISGMSYKTALVIQAIKEFGKGKVDEITIEKIRAALTEKELELLLEESKSSWAWIYDVVKKIVGGN